MKAGIHPTYHKTTVKCACGAKHEFGSTMESYEVEICSNCHPFYTGKQKLVDTAGRVDKFRSRQKIYEEKKAKIEAQQKSKKKVETVEEKMTRKAAEKEAEKEAEKAKKEDAKKKAAKKKADEVIVKKADNTEEANPSTDSGSDEK